MIEESPSTAVDNEVRMKMCEAAIKGAKSVNYIGAGTIEFLMDSDSNFYFMDNMKRIIVIVSLISLMIPGCASVFSFKPISFHYDEIQQETTYSTRDLYLIERNVPPYVLKLSVSKSCPGNFLDSFPR